MLLCPFMGVISLLTDFHTNRQQKQSVSKLCLWEWHSLNSKNQHPARQCYPQHFWCTSPGCLFLSLKSMRFEQISLLLVFLACHWCYLYSVLLIICIMPVLQNIYHALWALDSASPQLISHSSINPLSKQPPSFIGLCDCPDELILLRLRVPIE